MSTSQDIDLGWEAFLDGLAEFNGKSAEVGVFPDDDPEVAEYAAVHEFGSPSNNIPETAFFRSAVDANMEHYKAIAGDGLKAIANGTASAAQTMEAIGAKAQADITDSIEANGLVDTGALKAAIKVKVS